MKTKAPVASWRRGATMLRFICKRNEEVLRWHYARRLERYDLPERSANLWCPWFDRLHFKCRDQRDGLRNVILTLMIIACVPSLCPDRRGSLWYSYWRDSDTFFRGRRSFPARGVIREYFLPSHLAQQETCAGGNAYFTTSHCAYIMQDNFVRKMPNSDRKWTIT